MFWLFGRNKKDVVPPSLRQEEAAKTEDGASVPDFAAHDFVEEVRRGEEALEHGEYLTHEQVGQRLERFLRP